MKFFINRKIILSGISIFLVTMFIPSYVYSEGLRSVNLKTRRAFEQQYGFAWREASKEIQNEFMGEYKKKLKKEHAVRKRYDQKRMRSKKQKKQNIVRKKKAYERKVKSRKMAAQRKLQAKRRKVEESRRRYKKIQARMKAQRKRASRR
ncbi:hypothetical protein MNBD_UNCLBAC01-706 [hydrothermal vent metagenome]|uniref:Uncharacterized protein n=1 Tax=hydrothermal vent metagenome TaxID=652676 RepID=A0A3B1DT14_9ZZZZ